MNTKSITSPHSASPDFNESGHLNIDFSDVIMSDASPKHLLRYWVDDIYWRARDAVDYYYDEDAIYCDEIGEELGRLSVVNHKEFVMTYFNYTNSAIEEIVRFLDCLVDKSICGIEAITIAVCGVNSDEACVITEFLRLYHNMSQWKETQMCEKWCDRKIHKILYNEDGYEIPEQ